MNTRLILICAEGPAREAYLTEAKALGITVDVVAGFGKFIQAMADTSYQGIMVDLITGMKASRAEKLAAQEILHIYPLIQLKWDSGAGTIRTISLGNNPGEGSLADFVADACRPFRPRTIRGTVRKSIHFNVEIRKAGDADPAAVERTVTTNASQRGCFVFTCRDWSDTSDVQLTFLDWSDKSPIQGEIRWHIPWGKAMTIPGIGIQFKKIKPEQIEELREKYFL